MILMIFPRIVIGPKEISNRRQNGRHHFTSRKWLIYFLTFFKGHVSCFLRRCWNVKKKYEEVLRIFLFFFFFDLTLISEGCNELRPLSNVYFWALLGSVVQTWTLKKPQSVCLPRRFKWFSKLPSSSWEFCSVEVLCPIYDYTTQRYWANTGSKVQRH